MLKMIKKWKSVVKTNFIHGGMEYPNLVIISDSVADINDYIKNYSDLTFEEYKQLKYGK